MRKLLVFASASRNMHRSGVLIAFIFLAGCTGAGGNSEPASVEADQVVRLTWTINSGSSVGDVSVRGSDLCQFRTSGGSITLQAEWNAGPTTSPQVEWILVDILHEEEVSRWTSSSPMEKVLDLAAGKYDLLVDNSGDADALIDQEFEVMIAGPGLEKL